MKLFITALLSVAAYIRPSKLKSSGWLWPTLQERPVPGPAASAPTISTSLPHPDPQILAASNLIRAVQPTTSTILPRSRSSGIIKLLVRLGRVLRLGTARMNIVHKKTSNHHCCQSRLSIFACRRLLVVVNRRNILTVPNLCKIGIIRRFTSPILHPIHRCNCNVLSIDLRNPSDHPISSSTDA